MPPSEPRVWSDSAEILAIETELTAPAARVARAMADSARATLYA
ncbi:hypothetical protein [Bailinhaonella thermotolerans]|nr:hypothetical protein [Bailinhaonella thermotolerans]